MNIWEGAGRRIRLQEVGTRDGLQAETVFVPTEAKIALIDELSLTGLCKIEVTSFTSPKAIPALRDADEVMRGIRTRHPGQHRRAEPGHVRQRKP
jgi:hydroxymethylglutaryl-CoA lyase